MEYMLRDLLKSPAQIFIVQEAPPLFESHIHQILSEMTDEEKAEIFKPLRGKLFYSLLCVQHHEQGDVQDQGSNSPAVLARESVVVGMRLLLYRKEGDMYSRNKAGTSRFLVVQVRFRYFGLHGGGASTDTIHGGMA